MTGMRRFKVLLKLIIDKSAEVDVDVDIRVLGTTPMVDGYAVNNVVISAINTEMRNVTEELNIDFTDVFMLEYPCQDDIAKMPGNKNHYFHRKGNEYAGQVGKIVYFSLFLKKMCPS
jgi:hypothetical protein